MPFPCFAKNKSFPTTYCRQKKYCFFETFKQLIKSVKAPETVHRVTEPLAISAPIQK
jgi:hypothetical protein